MSTDFACQRSLIDLLWGAGPSCLPSHRLVRLHLVCHELGGSLTHSAEHCMRYSRCSVWSTHPHCLRARCARGVLLLSASMPGGPRRRAASRQGTLQTCCMQASSLVPRGSALVSVCGRVRCRRGRLGGTGERSQRPAGMGAFRSLPISNESWRNSRLCLCISRFAAPAPKAIGLL